MRRKASGFIVALALFAVAGLAVAQNADQNTGGPTKNTLQLRLLEPVAGASITGSSVRVSVGWNTKAFGTGEGTKFGEANFPQPRFDVYLDNSLKASLKGTESNTTVIENVPAGSHKVVVVALNVSGEIIDRKEVSVTTSPMVVAESANTTSMTAPAPAPPPAPAYQPPPAPAPVIAQSAPAPPPPAQIETTLPKKLPKTASPAPRFALLGLAFVAVGLLIARRKAS